MEDAEFYARQFDIPEDRVYEIIRPKYDRYWIRDPRRGMWWNVMSMSGQDIARRYLNIPAGATSRMVDNAVFRAIKEGTTGILKIRDNSLPKEMQKEEVITEQDIAQRRRRR